MGTTMGTTMGTVTEDRTYKLRYLQGVIRTTLSIDGRLVVLVSDADGNIRQVRGMTADPRVDAAVAEAVREMPDWTVEAWPRDYEPVEEVVALAEDDETPGGQSARGRKLDMLSKLKTIGRLGQIEDPDYEVAALMAEFTQLRERLATVTRERDDAIAEVASLRRVIEAAGRTQGSAASLPGPDPDEGRVPPTAKKLGKGGTLREELVAADIDPADHGLPAADGDDDDEAAAPIAGALAGVAKKK